MEKQPMLFDFGSPDLPAYQRHSPTSKAAAVEIVGSLNQLQKTVLDFIRRKGLFGVTDEEGIDGTMLSPSTYRPRRIELVALGLVSDSGIVRKTRSKRDAVVWISPCA